MSTNGNSAYEMVNILFTLIPKSTYRQHITLTVCISFPYAAGAPSLQKVKAANKLRVQTSKIVSSFKNDSVSCRMVREYAGHRDGVWDVAVSRGGTPVIATASAGETVGWFVCEFKGRSR